MFSVHLFNLRGAAKFAKYQQGGVYHSCLSGVCPLTLGTNAFPAQASIVTLGADHETFIG